MQPAFFIEHESRDLIFQNVFFFLFAELFLIFLQCSPFLAFQYVASLLIFLKM